MINVTDYILMILSKKKWTKRRLCDELNEIEIKIGDKKTSITNLDNFFNGTWAFRPKFLAKIELALGVKKGILLNMVAPPITDEGKKELRETIDRLNKI